MTERTAINPAEIAGVHRPLTSIEIAEDLESGLNSYGTCALAAKTIREQHAEIERLQRIIDSRPVVNAGNDLLPCPFCGGRAEMDTMTPFTSIFTGMSETGISAYCTDCSAEIMVCRPDVPDVTEEMVAEMWNTRAPRTCLACCRDVKNIHK